MARQKTRKQKRPLEVAFKDPHLMKLARRGGVKRISADSYEASRNIAEEIMYETLRIASISLEHSGRKKLEVSDVIFGIRSQGMKVYGTKLPSK